MFAPGSQTAQKPHSRKMEHRLMSRISIRPKFSFPGLGPVFAGAVLFAAAMLTGGAAFAQNADEAELSQHFKTVDVWHFPVDYSVAYNNQDVAVTRELAAQPAPAGELCYIRFDFLSGDGEYAYGFKPAAAGGAPARPGQWGVILHRRGTVLNQLRSALRMNVVYFYVDGPKDAEAAQICARKQAADTAEAGHGYKGKEWSDLITRGKLIHGLPQASPK
jgi:hypothetical protein